MPIKEKYDRGPSMRANRILLVIFFTGIWLFFASTIGEKTKSININIKGSDFSIKTQDITPTIGVRPNLNFGTFPLYFITSTNKGEEGAGRKIITAEQLHRKWNKLSSKALIKAARRIEKLAAPVIKSVKAVLALFTNTL